MSNENSKADWGKLELLRTFDLARSNQLASFQNCPNGVQRLSQINDCFELLAQNMHNPQSIIPTLLFARSHHAYIAACGAAMSGSSAETFAMTRIGIEAAGYALLVHTTPKLAEVWLNRSSDKKQTRKEFTHEAVRRCIESHDKKLSSIYSGLYEAAIDWGAHPNEMAITGSMTVTKKDGESQYAVRYLDDRPLIICHAMKSAAESGLCSLHIFQHIIPERFNLLGVRDRLVPLREDLSKVFRPPVASSP
jgi:hypothetical protein